MKPKTVWAVIFHQNKLLQISKFPVVGNRVIVVKSRRREAGWEPSFTPESIFTFNVEVPRKIAFIPLKPVAVTAQAVILVEGRNEAIHLTGDQIVDPETGLLHPLGISDMTAMVNYIISQAIEKEKKLNLIGFLTLIFVLVDLVLGIVNLVIHR
jgi:hypothetical protein